MQFRERERETLTAPSAKSNKQGGRLWALKIKQHFS